MTSKVKHNPAILKGQPWRYCKGCGLVFLKNEITELCKRLGCDFEDHPEYLKWRKK